MASSGSRDSPGLRDSVKHRETGILVPHGDVPALAGALVIGPRLGRYGKDGRPRAMPGHNLVFASLGVFLLWFGWFGFNAGSTTTADTSIALIAVNTNLSAAAGAVAASLSGSGPSLFALCRGEDR